MLFVRKRRRGDSLKQQTSVQLKNDEKWHIRSEFCEYKKQSDDEGLFELIFNLVPMQEQLLEEQQQELELLRIAKLRELEKRKARFTERKYKGKNLREHSIFYTTVTLAFFSVSAGASILFLVPLYVGEFFFCVIVVNRLNVDCRVSETFPPSHRLASIIMYVISLLSLESHPKFETK